MFATFDLLSMVNQAGNHHEKPPCYTTDHFL